MSLLEDITRRVEETGKQLTRQMEELNALGNAEKTTHELRKALEQSAGSLSVAVHEISTILSKTEEHMAGIREETRRSREELQKIGKGTESEIDKAVRQVETALESMTQEVGNAVQRLLETEPALVAKSMRDLLNSVEEVKRREEENQQKTKGLITAMQELLGDVKRDGEYLVEMAKTVEQLEKQMKNFETQMGQESQKRTNDIVTSIQGLFTKEEQQCRDINSLRGEVKQFEEQMKNFKAEMGQQIAVLMKQTEGGWKRWLRW